MTPIEGERKHPQDLKPEFLVLGLLAQGPAHGYELMRRFNDSLAWLWHISESQFYATLKRAESRGLVEPAEPGMAAGAARRHLVMTAAGREAFLRWLEEPTAGSPRLVHMEFLSRLHFARLCEPSLAAPMVAAQAASLAADLERVRALKEEAVGELQSISADFRERQLRAVLEWIEGAVAPSIRGAAAAPPPGPSAASSAERRGT